MVRQSANAGYRHQQDHEAIPRRGYTRDADPVLESPYVIEEDVDNGILPDTIEIDGRLDQPKDLSNVDDAAELATPTGVDEPLNTHVKVPAAVKPIPKLADLHPTNK